MIPYSKLHSFPAFWSRDINMYLIFSAFTSGPISLKVNNKVYEIRHEVLS